jgi:predicted nucleotidyltransferase
MRLEAGEEEAIRALKKELGQRYKPIDMRLFGSKARGEGSPDSDIDVFIVLQEVNWKVEREIYDLCFEISLEHDVLISPIIFSKEELKDPAMRSSPFLAAVEREGIPL